MDSWPLLNAKLYFTGSDAAIYTTKTDANGKFSFILPVGASYVVCAKGERHIALLDNSEKYFWIVDVDFDGALEKEVLLSNHNELTRSESESPVKLLKLPFTLEESEN